MIKELIMGEKEHIQEADTRLYTRDLVIQDCNSYIKQYLEKDNLLRTCREFMRECKELQVPTPTLLNEGFTVISEETNALLLDTFDNIEEEEFFEVWDNTELVPHEEGSKVYLKLNFKLHIYFAVQKINHELEPIADCLQQVRQFFDVEGSSLSDEQEFVHYYALPFVSNPSSHPTFKSLFQESWSRRLRCDVCEYIQSLRELCQESVLVKIVLVHCGVTSGTPEHQSCPPSPTQLNIIKNQYANLLQNHQRLRQEYQKLISVTAELTSGLEGVAQARMGDQMEVDWKNILLKCNSLFPELFNQLENHSEMGNAENENQVENKRLALPAPAEDERLVPDKDLVQLPPPPDWSVREDPLQIDPTLSSPPAQPFSDSDPSWCQNRVESPVQIINQDRNNQSHVFQQNNVQMSATFISVKLTPENLNFPAIQEELEGHQVRNKILLMQALRWFLTKSNQSEKTSVIKAFVENDLLGFDHQPQVSTRLLSCFLPVGAKIPHLVQGSLARLVNAMASARMGREYLATYQRLIETLIDCLIFIGGQLEEITVDMIIATLQKLSLKFVIRKKMIERGLIAWLVTDYLSKAEVKIYGLEYSTALLMNLCLHRSGKEQCVPIATTVLEILVNLLIRDIKPINPYVNGALYSLLGNKDINIVAQNMGIEHKIVEKCHVCEEETRRQLEYILDQLRSTESNSEDNSIISDDESDEAVDEDIEIEEEIDEIDPVVARPYEMSGFDLLEKRYFCPPTVYNDVPSNFINPDERPIKPQTGNYDGIEETEEETEKETYFIKENDTPDDESKPKSKTKFEKDQENMLSKAEKNKNKNRDKNIESKKLKDIQNTSKVEKELILESDSSSTSNWVTESEATISIRIEEVVNGTLEKLEIEGETSCNKEGDFKREETNCILNNESANDPEDGHVIVESEPTEPDFKDTNSKETPDITSKEEGKNEVTAKNSQNQPLKRKSTGVKGKVPQSERSRGNIPSSTGRSILRSHSGTWRKLGRRQKQSQEKISISLPSEEPFQPNLVKHSVKINDDKTVELPKLPVEQLSTSSPTPVRNRSPSSPPLPPVRPPGTPPSQPGSTRVSRSIENVISKLDRRSMSVLPQIGKTSPDEGAAQSGGSSCASSADRLAEKRTISMTFPYTPLSQIEGQLAVTPPSPRKRWKKVPPSQPQLITLSCNYLNSSSQIFPKRRVPSNLLVQAKSNAVPAPTNPCGNSGKIAAAGQAGQDTGLQDQGGPNT